MVFILLKNEVKQELKNLTKQIQDEKFSIKYKNNKDKKILSNLNKLEKLKYQYRNKHIAYCQFFNNTNYNQIEVPNNNNYPNGFLIEENKSNWIKKLY